MFQGFKQFTDGMSQTKYAMWATILANIINIVLNYVLIFGKLGFPEMGIIGAAIGTLVIVNLGFPSALQMFFEVAIFTAAIWLSGVLGENPQAANQIALNLSSMTFMIAMGLSVTAMIRVGNQKGVGNFKELRRIALSIFLLVILLDIVFAMIFFICNTQLPRIYVDENDVVNLIANREVIAIAAKLLLVAAVFQISDGIQVVVLGALRGMQDVKIPTLITFIAYWVVGFPVSYFLGKAEVYGSVGIWLGLLAGLTASAIMLYIRFNYLTKKLIIEKSS